jgi:hypothetical protein
MPYGRSGNRLNQLRKVHEVLAMCSGVATATDEVNNDPTVIFPPMLIAPAVTSSATINHAALETTARICRRVNYLGKGFDDAVRMCRGSGLRYRVQQDWWTKDGRTGLEQPALLPYVMVEKRAWDYIFDSCTMVMYFRGGDILRINPHPKYSQAPCSLFLESWKLIAPKHAMLVYERNDTINPCVEVMEQHIPANQRLQPPCDGAGCHMSLLGRAPYVVVSGTSTFAANSFLLFPEAKRVVFEYFCNTEPHQIGSSLHVCVNGSTHGLIPWNYTDTTRKQMLDIRSSVVLGGFNASYVKEHVFTRNRTASARCNGHIWGSPCAIRGGSRPRTGVERRVQARPPSACGPTSPNPSSG